MAISVYTWSEFVSAFQGSETEIEIMANLNCNDDPLSASLRPGSNKTINGNYHSIDHLGTQNPLGAPMIQNNSPDGTAKDIVWQKVNFKKIISNESQPVFSAGSNHPMTFTDCTIQGQGTQFATYINMTRCSVTWEGAGFENVSLVYCWIHLVEFRKDNFNQDHVIFGSMDTCYLEGEITHAAGVTRTGRITGWIANSCVNIITHEGPFWPVIASGGDSNRLGAVNMDKFKGSLGRDYYCVQVTDAQMHNAAYLASVGFDIVS